MVILDTDHLTIIQRQNQPIYSILSARFRHIPASDLCSTIISVEEQMRGWLAVIGRSRGLGQEIAAYRHLHALLSFFSAIPILEFDEPAGERYLQFRPLTHPTRFHGFEDRRYRYIPRRNTRVPQS
jgi:tRNA(fMet)-specific endonuclease VapC